MDKKKLLMAVFLFAALLFLGILLPLLLSKDSAPLKESSKPNTKEPATQEADAPEVTYLQFDALEGFMAETKITELKALFPQYLKKAGLDGITSISFLSDQSSYPSSKEVRLMFTLSDESTMLVSYDRDGRFLFGEERTLLSDETKTYPKPADDKLPKLSPSDIEKMQEGGYPDTAKPVKPKTKKGE